MQEYTTLPTKIVLQLLFNDRRNTFDPTDLESHLEKDNVYTYEEFAALLKAIDPNEECIHVEKPGDFNNNIRYCVWQREAWRAGESRRAKMRQQWELQRKILADRDKAISLLMNKILIERGMNPYDEHDRKKVLYESYGLVHNRRVDFCREVYDIDISFVSEDIRKYEVVDGAIEAHFMKLWKVS